MRNVLLSFIVVCSVLGSVSVFAAGEQSSPSKVSFMTIGENYARVRMESMTSGVQGCLKQEFYILDLTNGVGKAQLSGILSAKSAGTVIYFFLNGCMNDYPKIGHTYLR